MSNIEKALSCQMRYYYNVQLNLDSTKMIGSENCLMKSRTLLNRKRNTHVYNITQSKLNIINIDILNYRL